MTADDIYLAMQAKHGLALRPAHDPATAGELHGWLLWYRAWVDYMTECRRLGLQDWDTTRDKQLAGWKYDVWRTERALEIIRSRPDYAPDKHYGYPSICEAIKQANKEHEQHAAESQKNS